MITGILYGTFDLLHFGHIEAIRYASSKCDKLIVAVSTDEFNEVKGKKAKIPYWQRSLIVSALELVDCVIPEYCWEQKSTDCEKHNAQIVFVSEDFFDETEKELGDMVEIKVIPRTPNISSTQIRGKLE